MILKSFLVFLPALVAGAGFAHLLWKDDSFSALGLKIFVGVGAGLGITSCLYFLRLLLFPGQGGYLLIELVCSALVLIVLLAKKRTSFHIPDRRIQLSPMQLLLGLTVISVAILSLYFLVIYARIIPHGDYDAQAIWNLRARFIHRLGDSWRTAFSPLINRNFHMDYPLLIPLSVVGGWNTLGSEVLRVPALLSILFLFGMAGITFSVICCLRSSSQAAIAVLLLLATPALVVFSTFQTADIPLTYFFLASASLLVIAGKENNRRLLFLAGLMAGLSAWTKNEGIPFAILIILCTIFIFGIRQAWMYLSSLLAGMLPPILTIVTFKTFISVNNDLFVNNGFYQILLKLLTPARYTEIFNHFLSEFIHLGNWPISIILILAIYGSIMGLKGLRDPAERVFWILPFAQFVIYMMIYVITPHDLEWHLNYSMSRLLIHLFPLGLCAFFLFVNTPESVINKVK